MTLLSTALKTISITTVFAILLFACNVSAQGDPVSTTFKSAISAYNQKNYAKVIQILKDPQHELKIIADYALFYRALAYQASADNVAALNDYNELIKSYPDSILVKKAQFNSIHLIDNITEKFKAFEQYLKSYPDDLTAKYRFAILLKENGQSDKATKLFKELYINASTHAKDAATHIDITKLTASELLMRCDNLKKMWYFQSAENCYKDAINLNLTTKNLYTAKDGLAYSFFRQKKYVESAKLYKELNQPLWRARSLFRASDMKTFESELPYLKKTSDKKIASVLISYATHKRRTGLLKDALAIYDEVISLYPSAAEDALWNKAWSLFLCDQKGQSKEIFVNLAKTYSNSKYHYWLRRLEQETSKNDNYTIAHRDFYAYLFFVINNTPIKPIKQEELNVSVTHNTAQRAKILHFAGLKNDASNELISLSKNTLDESMQIFVSHELKQLENYKSSIAIILKQPYRHILHSLYYPIVYSDEVNEAVANTGLDANLIFAIIREESRFDPDARSIAGALGLMQIMPQTARRIQHQTKVTLSTDADLLKPRVNILIGSQYIKNLINRFHSIPVAIAAYNAGEEAVTRWLRDGKYTSADMFIEDIPYDETRNYVKRVLTTYFEYSRYYGGHIPQGLMQFNN